MCLTSIGEQVEFVTLKTKHRQGLRLKSITSHKHTPNIGACDSGGGTMEQVRNHSIL